MLRRALAIVAAVFAVVALTAIAIWAFATFPERREFGPTLEAFDTIADFRRWFLQWATALVVLLAIFRRARAIYLGALVGIVTTSFYAQFYFFRLPRLDRVRGEVFEYWPGARELAVAVAVSIGLALLYAALTRRHAPLVILCALLLPIWFLPFVLPYTGGWFPAEWDRPDLLIPYRPCRGAALWSREGSRPMMLRIDDIWEHFEHPRAGITRAVSGRAGSCTATTG